jgi:hypothetical protein
MEGAGKMKSREVRWITAAVAAGMLAAVAIGQTEPEKPAAPATGSKIPQTGERAGKRDRDPAQDPAQDTATGSGAPRDIKESAPGKSVRMRGQTGGISEAQRELWRWALTAEAKFRKRLAQVRRYRELAEAAGDKKRVVKADYLENKIRQVHAKQMERARARLGDEKFNLIKGRIEHGRQRRGSTGKGGPARTGQAHDEKRGPDVKQGPEGTATGTAAGRGGTGTTAPGAGPQDQQDPQKRSRSRSGKDTGQRKSEDS